MARLAMTSIGEHGQCGLALSGLQFQKSRAGNLDVSLGTALGGGLEGNRRRMRRTADENQSFGQTPHGGVVNSGFFHPV